MAELPKLSAIPRARSAAPILRIRLYAVLGLLGLSSLLGVLSTAAWLANKPPVIDASFGAAKGRATAEIVAREFLAGKAFSVPVAKDPSLTRYDRETALDYRSLAWQSFTTGSFYTGAVTETHRFLVTAVIEALPGSASSTYRRFLLDVVVVIPPAGSDTAPYLAALPTMLPDLVVEETGPALYYDSSVSTQTPKSEDVGRVVTDWASAYVSDNRAALRDISGDPEPGYEYQGLGGFTVTSVTARYAPIDEAETEFVVQLRISVKGSGEGGYPEEFTTDLEIELTVVAADTASPKVQGWGPIGVGPVAAGTNRVPA